MRGKWGKKDLYDEFGARFEHEVAVLKKIVCGLCRYVLDKDQLTENI